MNQERVIEVTADGSHTLFVPSMDEHYHSVNGAVQESEHVFIEAGFRQVKKQVVRVFEVGFGTGLNALLTLAEIATGEQKKVVYYTVEAYPLSIELAGQLNYTRQILDVTPEDYLSLHQAAWNVPVPVTPNFTLYKIEGDSNRIELPGNLDVVYFDAFAPDKQPDLWNQELFDRIYRQMNPGGIITTYCAKGVVRRMMQTAGFTMERLPGPPGKREMLRGRK
ncbi:MAG: tRNA (5-methylaminomethyl-2-thiouridine)(34)-methyltransferase MnmD [Tannerellaceae bacterium]|nr:tRNA (5-methylaminomethyl-2-thiouridine)(34)-methyltransferase MnmD [Tannerellaceae bacterium]